MRDFQCQSCSKKFETLMSSSETQNPACPKCGAATDRLISKFSVAGRGDLRESTIHGCHDINMGPLGSEAPSSGHSCGGGCHHGASASGASGSTETE